jgi:hypothetical protein
MWLNRLSLGGIYLPTLSESLIFGQSLSYELVDPLVDNLLALWKCEESGNLTDSVNGYTLTARNSPTQITGKVGYGQQYSQTNISCHYKLAGLGGNNNSFTVCLWVKSIAAPDSGDNFYFVLENNTGMTFYIRHSLSNAKHLCGLSPDSGSTHYNVSGDDVIVVGTWYFILVEYTSNVSLTLWINNVQTDSIAASGGRAVGRIVLGASKYDGTGADDVQVDAIHWWDNYLLDSDERTYMYNSGNGRELL